MIDIETIDEAKIQNLVNDLALLTLTNASDWSYRFFSVGDQKNPTRKGGIVFSHPSGQQFHAFTLDFGTESEQPKFDVEIRFEGALALFEPRTSRASSWIDRHVEHPIYFGPRTRRRAAVRETSRQGHACRRFVAGLRKASRRFKRREQGYANWRAAESHRGRAAGTASRKSRAEAGADHP